MPQMHYKRKVFSEKIRLKLCVPFVDSAELLSFRQDGIILAIMKNNRPGRDGVMQCETKGNFALD